MSLSYLRALLITDPLVVIITSILGTLDLIASFFGLVVTLALDFLLIPRYGFRGAAIASSIAYTCAMLVDLVWVTRTSSITLTGLLIARPSDVRLLWQRTREAMSGAIGLGWERIRRDPRSPDS